jgi:chemotaxis signal transduction protein
LPGWGRGSAGLTAWRGSLLLIVDVRDLLGVASAPNTNIDRVIVMKSDVMTAGVIVDEIMGIEQVGADISTSLPERMSSIGTGVVKGITGKGVIVLDPAQLLEQHV